MKVTVCFGSVRIVVPCGAGDILVRELIDKSVVRYKKAIGKPPDYWVNVANLKSSSDGGILDPDDQLTDVADDREQIIAIYEEQGVPSVHLHHNGGDGTSASSVGTSSPDMFQGGELNNHVYLRQGSKNDVIITQSDLTTAGSSLIVRRGSEPALTQIGVDSPPRGQRDFYPVKTNKRWSAIAAIDETRSNRDSDDGMADDDDDTPPPTLERVGGNGQEKDRDQNDLSFSTFARESARRSLANNAALHKWLEAQERQQERQFRKDPVGSTAKDDENVERVNGHTLEEPLPKGASGIIAMKNTGGPLGIHVVPDYDETGRDMGLVIQGIEAGGRIYRDGRLHVQDRIVEINGTSLVDVNFSKAQEVFKQALQSEEIRLRVLKSQAPPLPKNPPPVLPKPVVNKPRDSVSSSHSSQASKAGSPTTSTPRKEEHHSSPDRMDDTNFELPSEINITTTVNDNNNNEGKLKEPVSPSKRLPPAVPTRHPNTVLSAQTKSKFVAPTNTRRIGKKIPILLTKGNQGLGFSITTRDNLAGGHCPIYIKNILPKGAAIQDGRLKPGDRLLEVNGVEMTGKTQSEAVTILRNTKLGSDVNLVVSRQVEALSLDESNNLPREIGDSAAVHLQPPEKTQDEGIPASSKERESKTFHIPLNESGAAGLGVSVKGKTSTSPLGSQDLGIFIKSIITGGAASKDERLRVNDQLIEINNESLVGKSNQDAMAILRKAMQREGPTPGYIDLTVVRKNSAQPPVSAEELSAREIRISQSDAQNEKLQSGKSAEQVKRDISDSNKDFTDSAFTVTGKPRNAAMERMAAAYAFRNVSYQKATHDSMMNDTTDSVFQNPRAVKGGLAISSPTLNTNRGETVLIEGENYEVQMRQNKLSDVPKARPASTLGFQEPDSVGSEKLTASRSTQDLLDEEEGVPKPPDWLSQWDQNQGEGDESELNPGEGFTREGFGRQSMSEKRKGYLDPKMSEFYQKIKQNKDRHQVYSATWDPRRSAFRQVEGSNFGGLRRAGSAESLLDQSNNRASLALHENWLRITGDDDREYQSEAELELLYQQKYKSAEPSPLYGSASFHFPATKPSELGPSLGLRKSSSLESLQTAVHEVTMEDDGGVWRGPNRSMVRGRGCNESFRAAVDHSYDDQEQMETLDEEGSECGSTSQGRDSRASSISGSEAQALKPGKKAAKQKNEKDKDKDKDKGGLFKGLGHMFRFGKHRKQLEDRAPQKTAEELKKERKEKNKSQTNLDEKAKADEEEKAKTAKAVQEEQERIKEHYKKLQEKQKAHEAQKAREEHVQRAREERARATAAAMPPPPVPQSRAEKIQHLRSEHQKRHRERQGQYPLDDREELYEKQIQDFERQYPGAIALQQEMLRERGLNPTYAIPPRRRVEDPYDSRPTSRIGYSDPNRYSHYANFHEIQEDMKRHDYYQQQYHQYMAAREAVARQHAAAQYGQHPLTDARQASSSSVHSAHGVPYYSRGQPPPPDPRNPRDPRNWDPRSQGQPGYYPSRSATPGAERPRPPSSPGRSQSQTPISMVGNSSYPYGKPLPPPGMPPPQIVVNPSHDPYGMARGRGYAEFNDPRSAYQGPPRESSYGSLPRTSRRERDPTLVSSSAQV